MIRSLSVILVAACSLVTCASPEAADLTASLDRLIERRADDSVAVSVRVIDLAKGEILYDRNPTLLMHPASTMKLLTSAAMCQRTPTWSVETLLEADKLPTGRLTLTGGGDALLDRDDLEALVKQLREQGLQRVEGPLVVLDPLAGQRRFGSGWMWDDEPASFMPHLSGVTTARGCVTVTVKREGEELKVTTKPRCGSLSVVVKRSPGAENVIIKRDWRHNLGTIEVTGDLPTGDTASRTISMPEPARCTASILRSILVEAGLAGPDLQIELPGPGEKPADPDARPAARAKLRRGLLEFLMQVNKPSDNLAAEMLLRHLPLSDQPPGKRGMATAEEGLQSIRACIATLGMDANVYRLVDGSGVSHYNLVSAELLVRVLQSMHAWKGAGFKIFLASLPIAGTDGTLKDRMRDSAAANRVRAKTGTISGVSDLAGYIETASGRDLVFAILVQNFVGPSSPWRALQDAVCAALADL